MRLSDLEETGNYLFHGSGYKVDILEPRQAYNFRTEENPVADDTPGVHATPHAGIAIFMAIVSKPNTPNGLKSSFGYSGDTITFGATKDTLDQVQKGAKGYVYVVDKKDFTKRTRFEYISYQPIKPVQIIEVTEQDLPKDITIIE